MATTCSLATVVACSRRGRMPCPNRCRGQIRRAKIVAHVRKVTGEELEVMLAERQKPMVIDFYADWCGPCVLMARELEKVSQELGDKVEVLKVDTEEEQDLASQLQIQSLPTLILVGLDAEKPALRTEGLVPAEQIKNYIMEYFPAPDNEVPQQGDSKPSSEDPK